MHSIWRFQRKNPPSSTGLPPAYLYFCERCGKEVFYYGSTGVPSGFEEDCDERVRNAESHEIEEEHWGSAFGIEIWISEGVAGSLYGHGWHCERCEEHVYELWVSRSEWVVTNDGKSINGMVEEVEIIRTGRGSEASCCKGRMRRALG